jgi:hypothetical protein
MAKSPAWQRKEGKNPSGGLNALCKNERYEKEANFCKDSKRS